MAIEDVVALKLRLGQWPSLGRQGVSMDTPCKVPEGSECSTPIGVAKGRNVRPLGSSIECAQGRDVRPLILGPAGTTKSAQRECMQHPIGVA